MPSGKRARQQRQQAVAAPPPVRSTGGGMGARQASPRTLGIAGGVLLVVIIAVVLAIVLSGGKSGASSSYDGSTIGIPSGFPATGNSASASALPGASDVAAMLKGIPQHGFTLGQPNAPVTLVEYIDTQCPVCDEFETTELKPLIDKYVRPGNLKIEMKLWNIIDAQHPGDDDSLRGQKAVIAAAKQNRAFNYAAVLYDNQGPEGGNWFNNAAAANIAASVDGLNLSQFANDANSSATANLIQQTDAYAASQPNFSGTPTLLLGKGNEAPKYYGTGGPAMLLSNLEPAIERLLHGK